MSSDSVLTSLFFKRKIGDYNIDTLSVGGVEVFMDNGIPYPVDFDATSNDIISLNGLWDFRIAGGTEDEVSVPHSFNTLGSPLEKYEGEFFYRKSFIVDEKKQERIYRLCCEGVSICSKIIINGKEIAANDDGYNAFYADLTPFLVSGNNTIEIEGNNIPATHITPIKQFEGHKAGWKVYAGITRSVYIEILPVNYIFYVRPSVDGKSIKCRIIAKGKVEEIKAELSYRGKSVDNGIFLCRYVNGFSFCDIVFDNVISGFWNKNNNELYKIKIADRYEEKTVSFANRSFRVDGDRLDFNGENFIAKGVCVHEENIEKGISLNADDIAKLYSLPVELNCNFVRLVHYPHSKESLSFLQKNGLLCWSEIPNYQAGLGMVQKVFDKSLEIKSKGKKLKEIVDAVKSTDQLCDKYYVENCMRQLARMVISKINYPCIVVWGVGNECYSYTPAAEKILQILKNTILRFDKSRLIGYAAFTIPKISARLEKSFRVFDIVAANEYYGWYYGKFSDAEKYWRRLSKYKKPMLITETGSDAAYQSSGIDLKNKNANSEDWQCSMINEHLRLVDKAGGLCGVCIWQLKDCFCEEYGPNDIVPYCNPKGLVSNTYQKKKAFTLVKNSYCRGIKDEK